MLERWGRAIHRIRWLVLASSALLLVVSIAVVIHGGTLTTGAIPSIESARATRVLAEELGVSGESSFTVIFDSPTLAASDPTFVSAMEDAVEPWRRDPRVATVHTPSRRPPPLDSPLLGRDGHSALAVVSLRAEFRTAATQYPSLRAQLAPCVLHTTFTGHLAFKSDLDAVLERDMRLAELLTGPLALVVLLLVFGSLVAAAVPVGVGALSVVGGMAAVMLLSRRTEVAQYAINIVSLVGLGVAIDYSLFVVSRFRDELADGADVATAVARTMASAGRAVLFSGLAVAIGLGGLLFYWGTYLASIGIAGSIVVGMSVVYSMTFLPALLSVLGRRIDAGRLPVRWPEGRGAWSALARWVMSRPFLVLVPLLALLLGLGSPFLRLRMASADLSALPRSAEARRGFERLRRDFPDSVATRVAVVVRFPSSPVLTPERVGALHDWSQRVRRIADVTAVESVVDFDARMSRADMIALHQSRAAQFIPALAAGIQDSVGARCIVMAVRTNAAPTSDRARAIVRAIRRQRTVGDGALLVTGWTANDVDSTEYIVGRAPRAVGFVVVAMLVVLFLLLGSVLLPLKAVVMNGLSIAGSFGALVWVFQDGHLASVLGFEAAPIEPSLPVVLFCTVFGLSMDYEVLLLTRIHEEYLRTGDNAHSVAAGLERSGRLITSAAAIMIAVFSAFAFASVVLIKAVGVGMAVAVALDATIVRVLLVPATMQLLGRLNWWAPRGLARLFGLRRGRA